MPYRAYVLREGRIDAFREMICSETAEEREKALEKVLPYQQDDFEVSLKLWKVTLLLSVSLIRLFMSSFLQRKLTSRNLQMLRAKL